ncbi:hypothetical protein NUSPORA_01684 [Nucleospora cyclopteri]
MLSDARRFIERKIKKIDYIHTKLPEGYEPVNDQYRKIRNEISVLQGVTKGLANYEFGGTMLKNISNWSAAIAESSNLKYLKKDDIYTDIAFVGAQLGASVSDKKLKGICQNFASAYENIAANKRKMNEKLHDVIQELNILKKKCRHIDHQRTSVRNTRYDLEELLQGNIFKEDEKDNLEERLKHISEKALIEMKEFMHLSLINGILVKIAKIHRDFSEQSTEDLSSFK